MTSNGCPPRRSPLAPTWEPLPRRLLAGGGAVLALALLWPVAVRGHARLVRSEPAAGAVVRVPPVLVRAWFSEELDPARSVINVRDARGALVGSGGVDLNDLERRSMVAGLKPLRPGTYTVAWQTVSALDADLLRGRFRFTVAPPGGEVVPQPRLLARAVEDR